MSFLDFLKNVLNASKKTPSTETPTITEPTTPAEPVDGSTTLTLADGGTSPRRLRRHWRLLKERFPNSQVSRADRYGMLCSRTDLGGGCKCMCCEKKFATWDEGREHECKDERDFRRITGRAKPRRGAQKKDRPGDTPQGSPGTGPGITTHRMGVVENIPGDNPSTGRSSTRRKG